MEKHFFNNVAELAGYMATLEPNKEKGTVEAMNITFVADSGDCIGTSSEEYRAAELGWFLSRDNNIEGLGIFNKGKIPKIWKDIANGSGVVNSNYGYRCLHPENGDGTHSQFELAMKQLILDKNSRRGIMIYNFPEIHSAAAGDRPVSWSWFEELPEPKEVGNLEYRREAFKELKTDMMCCQNSIFSIEGNKLNMSSMMRSLDLRFGLPHDWEWWNYAFDLAVEYLKPYYPEIERGTMYVSAVSAHVYERHYKLLDKFKKPEKSLEEEMMAKHIADSRDTWIKQEREMNKSFFTTPSNWASDIKPANFDNPQNNPELKPYCSVELPKGPFVTVRENLFDKLEKHEKDVKEKDEAVENGDYVHSGKSIAKAVADVQKYKNALDQEYEAGEPAYFGSQSFAVHGGEPLKHEEREIQITGDSRYKANTIEHWDVEERHDWGYKLGCASKYVYRNRFKGQQEADLKKIIEYANKHMRMIEKEPMRLTINRYKDPVIFLPEEIDGLTHMELGMIRVIEALSKARDMDEAEEMFALLCAFVEAAQEDDTSNLVHFSGHKKRMDWILTGRGK